MTATLTRAQLETLDRGDPLASFRDGFLLPAGVVYLDGNSLGPLPRATPERLQEVIHQQWGRDLVRSWNEHGWIDLPRRVGDKIARLIGAQPGEVLVADSTSVNLFKLLAAALALRPERRTILSERGNFPTDLYIMQGLVDLAGGRHRLRLVEGDGTPAPVLAALDQDVAVVALTQVNFKTGALYDLAAITAAAHRCGALVLWDLAHSAGALPVDLGGCDADLAVGCGYKFLNGGPGAPAFLYVAGRLQAEVRQPLTGWLGHARPFDFEVDYHPAAGIARHLCGTPPILSLAALDAGLDLLLAADLQQVRAKSMRMGELFLRLVAERCAGQGFTVACPPEAVQRGSQVCLRHPEGYAIVQALITRGVIGDFRAPDVLRFGLAPLYLRYQDVWDAVETLRQVMEGGEWRRPELQHRAAVT